MPRPSLKRCMAASSPNTTKLVKRFRGAVHRALHTVSPSLLRLVSKRFAHSCSENWRYRAKLVCACPDYAYIQRVPNAGEVVNGCQVMHNGLKVRVGSFYGEGTRILFSRTKGVHEPQEERVFAQVLKLVKPGSVMVELGAYWSFYSMWFCQQVQAANAFLIEPVPSNLEFGRKNFELNGFQGDFTQAYVGRTASVSADGIKTICLDDFAAEKGIRRIAILHSDIQGFEFDMLQGAERLIREGRIDYYFISTHSQEIHNQCETYLRQRHLRVIASINLLESFSMDGILVCAHPEALQPEPMALSRRAAQP